MEVGPQFLLKFGEVPVRLEGSFALLGCLALVSLSGHSKMCESDGKRRVRPGKGRCGAAGTGTAAKRGRSAAGPGGVCSALSLRRG